MKKNCLQSLKSSNVGNEDIYCYIFAWIKKTNLNVKTDEPMVQRIQDTIEYVFDKANDYERIKEKLIGETFEYAPEFTYIINGLLMRYERYPELIRFLRHKFNI